MGVAAADDGLVFVCDGVYGYNLNRTAGLSVEALQLAGMIFWPGCPGYMRGVAPGAASGEWLITAGLGSVARYRPALGESDFLGHGFDQLMGITTSDSGAVLFVEMGTGRVHLAEGETIRPIAEGLDQPMGIAVQGRTAFVTEAGAGRIARLRQDSPVDTIAEGLGRPEGLCLSGGQLYAVDTMGKRLLEIDPESGAVTTVASNLSVGGPPGVIPKFLGPIGELAGPMVNFAGVASRPDGIIYIAADAEGSVLAIRTGSRQLS